MDDRAAMTRGVAHSGACMVLDCMLAHLHAGPQYQQHLHKGTQLVIVVDFQ
jgi:hypothetical protein